MLNIDQFFKQFKFDKSKTGMIGVEREQFVVDQRKQIVPFAQRYLEEISTANGRLNRDKFDFGYELSACQLESKIGPCKLENLRDWLHECECFLSGIDETLSLSRISCELAPQDMPLDIYPDPTGRYQSITRNMPEQVLSAACRVAATHIHVGMPDIHTAIAAYGKALAHTERLIGLGDNSSGKRMALYRIMANRHNPEPIANPDEFYSQSVIHGFTDDPRKCWTIIRISVHGTVEFRMFGATDSTDRIAEWASQCLELCF